jgi:predicted DNA-binding protein (MmcQ/YjbR family)
MDYATLHTYLLAQPGTSEETPFGPESLVYKVAGKMFALLAWQEEPLRITLKADPARVEAQREEYPAVQPGYYMNKRHWNTIRLDGTVPVATLTAMIDESYRLVVKGLSKIQRDRLTAGGE